MKDSKILLTIADWFLDTNQSTPVLPDTVDSDLVVFFCVFLARKHQMSESEFRSAWPEFPHPEKFNSMYAEQEQRVSSMRSGPKFWEINTAAIIAFPTQNQWQ